MSHIRFRYLSPLYTALTVLLCSVLLLNVNPGSAYSEVLLQEKTLDYYGINPEDLPDIEQGAAVIMDDQANLIFSQNAHERRSVASLTKIMTAMVAIQHAPMDLQITTSERAATVGESTANLQYGDVLTLEHALYGLLMNSGNDCAIAIAECVGRYINDTHLQNEEINDEQAFDLFVSKMNETAQALGCDNTYFANPHGLDYDEHDEGQYCTAYDIGLMTKSAMEIELFRTIVSTVEREIPVYANGTEEYSCLLENGNKLLSEGMQGANGVKTGYTDAALSCLSSSAQRDGREFYAIALGTDPGLMAKEECEEMLEWAFANVSLCETQTTKFYIEDIPVYASVSAQDWLNESVYATVDTQMSPLNYLPVLGEVETSVSFSDLNGAILKGEKVGEITFSQNDNVIHKANLISMENLAKPSFFQSSWIEIQRALNQSKSSNEFAPNILYNL